MQLSCFCLCLHALNWVSTWKKRGFTHFVFVPLQGFRTQPCSYDVLLVSSDHVPGPECTVRTNRMKQASYDLHHLFLCSVMDGWWQNLHSPAFFPVYTNNIHCRCFNCFQHLQTTMVCCSKLQLTVWSTPCEYTETIYFMGGALFQNNRCAVQRPKEFVLYSGRYQNTPLHTLTKHVV